ncbi:hypothetical protein BXO91_09370 [Rhodococcus qingshengii]|nr:hypothetical protein BXO91_09370 [Rhodococcus qingshengii]
MNTYRRPACVGRRYDLDQVSFLSCPYGPPGGMNLFVIQFDASISSRVVRRTSVANVHAVPSVRSIPNTEQDWKLFSRPN